jgi:hypothetical protein
MAREVISSTGRQQQPRSTYQRVDSGETIFLEQIAEPVVDHRLAAMQNVEHVAKGPLGLQQGKRTVSLRSLAPSAADSGRTLSSRFVGRFVSKWKRQRSLTGLTSAW